MLRRQFPKLHVYAYGPLPCVDFDVADACSEFVTSVVYDNEFSSRLSVASILRLRAAAIKALSDDAATDSSTVLKLARHFLYLRYCLQSQNTTKERDSDLDITAEMVKDHEHQITCNQHDYTNASFKQDPDSPFCINMEIEDSLNNEADMSDSKCGFTWNFGRSSASIKPFDDPVPQFKEAVRSCEFVSSTTVPEMYLPGLIIHIVPERINELTPLWKRWRTFDKGSSHRAYIAKREGFKDFVVSPYMFLDHLPWRCYSAVKKVIEVKKFQNPQVVAQIV